jgi:hypothetical protein
VRPSGGKGYSAARPSGQLSQTGYGSSEPKSEGLTRGNQRTGKKRRPVMPESVSGARTVERIFESDCQGSGNSWAP